MEGLSHWSNVYWVGSWVKRKVEILVRLFVVWCANNWYSHSWDRLVDQKITRRHCDCLLAIYHLDHESLLWGDNAGIRAFLVCSCIRIKTIVNEIDRKHLVSPRGSLIEILSFDCAMTRRIDVRHLKVVTKVDSRVSYPGSVCKEHVFVWIVVVLPIITPTIQIATEWLKCLDLILVGNDHRSIDWIAPVI